MIQEPIDAAHHLDEAAKKSRKPKPDAVASIEKYVESLAPSTHFRKIPIADIIVPDRLNEDRKFDPEHAKDLAENLKSNELHDPVTVSPITEGPNVGKWELNAGRHRLAAFVLLERTEIDGNVVIYKSDAARDLMALASNLLRLEFRKGHEFDAALAKMDRLYKQLHPETIQRVAGGKARGGQKALEADGKKGESKPATNGPVKSLGPVKPRPEPVLDKTVEPKPAPAPTFAESYAQATGTSERTVHRAVKRGNTFTDDDRNVFARAGILITDQDKIAAVEDPAKRALVIAGLARGVGIKAAWTSAFPEGDAIDADESSLSDEEFLDACPTHAKSVKSLFKLHAILWRRTFPERDKLAKRLRKQFKELGGDKLPATKGSYMAKVMDFLAIPHPKDWQVCGTCFGTGRIKDKGTCADCAGGGFKVPQGVFKRVGQRQNEEEQARKETR